MAHGEPGPTDDVVHEAARRAAADLWYDSAEPPLTVGPLAFALVAFRASGMRQDDMARQMHDAAERLGRGATAREVAAHLERQRHGDRGVMLARSAEELAAFLERGFELGDNALDVFAFDEACGKRIAYCFTRLSADRRLF